MDITEIRAKYLEILAEKCLVCFNNIDSILVNSYNNIMKHEPIEIHRTRISMSDFSSVYRKDIAKEIQQHYAENWDVVYTDKKEHFIFSYKGDLTIPPQEQKQEPEVKKVIDEEKQTDRYKILDFK